MKTRLQILMAEAAKIVGMIKLPPQKPEDKDKVSKAQLNGLEKQLDALFANINIDVEFTKHWLDRVNDARNKKQITIPEISQLFTKTYQKYASMLSKADVDWEAVLKDTQTDINSPFVLNWDKKHGLQLVAKTVMRKKNFKSPDPMLKV